MIFYYGTTCNKFSGNKYWQKMIVGNCFIIDLGHAIGLFSLLVAKLLYTVLQSFANNGL